MLTIDFRQLLEFTSVRFYIFCLIDIIIVIYQDSKSSPNVLYMYSYISICTLLVCMYFIIECIELYKLFY